MGKKEKNFMEKIPSLQETILWNRQWIVYKLFIRIYFLKFEFGHHIMHECENSTSHIPFQGIVEVLLQMVQKCMVQAPSGGSSFSGSGKYCRFLLVEFIVQYVCKKLDSEKYVPIQF
jgi:hypothetical protein